MKSTCAKTAKQATLDNLPKSPKEKAAPTRKEIIITQIDATPKIDEELAIKAAFKLQPSRTIYCRLKADLRFDSHLIHSVLIKVLQGPLATEESEFAAVLDMNGVSAGLHLIKLELYEPSSSGQKLCQTMREMTVDYLPQTRQSRLVRVPTVKSVAGADLAVVSNSQKDIYDELRETQKKEQLCKKDNW
jgi:hypothetical protein